MEISELETRIDELVALSTELARKNAVTEAERAKWLAERSQLVEKNEQARSKIEAMIRRLKSLEQS